VPEVGRHGARILALIGEFVAAGVTQHLRVDAELHVGGFTKPGEHPTEPGGDHWMIDVASR
jgi:hypothetical protein